MYPNNLNSSRFSNNYQPGYNYNSTGNGLFNGPQQTYQPSYQDGMNNHHPQQNSNNLAEEEAAAIKIQSVYRGYKTRADLKTVSSISFQIFLF